MYTTLQNTPITINLLEQGNSRGWSIEGTDAVHETCNSGDLGLVTYPITAGLTYEVSYQVKNISGGYVVLSLGGATSVNRTGAGFYTDTLTATTNATAKFFSNANTRLSVFVPRIVTNVLNVKSQDTIVWSEKNNKWSDWRGYNPDCGYSLFTNLFTYNNGSLYRHSLLNTRNNFYGVQHPTIVDIPFNAGKTQPKTFEAISYESNMLMITTADGIKTSLGKISELIDVDFLKDTLDDGVTQIEIFDVEGIYSAGFMKSKPDLINGSPLKGTWITIELIQVNVGVLKLSNVYVHSEHSAIGSR